GSGRRGGCPALTVVADDAEELFHIEGLREPVLKPETPRLLLRLAVPRVERDGDVMPLWAPALNVAEFFAGHSRHHHVEQDEAGAQSALECRERVLAIYRARDAVALAFEQRRDGTTGIGVVLNNEDDVPVHTFRLRHRAARVHPCPPRWWGGPGRIRMNHVRTTACG